MHHIRKICSRIGFLRAQRAAFFHLESECRSTVEQPPGERKDAQFSIPTGILGQATCFTHPHMVPKDHLTCGITQAEYKERRETFVAKLVAEVDSTHKTHIIVIPAARKQYMSDKIPYVFRQNSDFFYLTGCLEPAAILVMVKPAHNDTYKSILFVHEKDSHIELWEGPRTGCSAATQLFAVDEARPVENFGNYLNKLSSESKPSLLWYHNESPSNPDIHQTVRSVLRPNSQMQLLDPQRVLHFMRVVKSPAEIELMKETCYIGAQAMNTAMACTKPGVSEHAINAVLEYSSRLQGAEHLAFPPVVGGGARATHIHYVTNNQLLEEGEMLLVDSGCQRWLYNSDISRTWPVSGKFSKYHRILYELVLSVQVSSVWKNKLLAIRPQLVAVAQIKNKNKQIDRFLIDLKIKEEKRLIEILAEHRPPLDQLFDAMCRLLGAKLQAEGILPKNLEPQQLLSESFRLCPHHVSHYLGLDVHDAPLVRRSTPVADGMVVTVEPGLYIQPDDDRVPAEFRGVGIRIEDDVLLTPTGVEILTDACAKELDDIEAIVGKHNS